MTNSSIQEKAIEAIIVLNAALTNIRLYPSSSAMIGNSIDSAYSILQAIFQQEDSVVFTESERNLIISGQALNEKDQKRPQVTAFIQLLLKLGIKSIAFEKGLERSEILTFLEVMSKKPQDLEKEGGLQKVMSTKDIKNILLDQKRYVAIEKDQRIVAAKEGKDRDIERFNERTTANKEGPLFDAERRSGEDRRKNDSLEYLASGGVERRSDEEQRTTQLLQTKAGIDSILKGEDGAFMDRQVMLSLPPTVLRLISQGKEKTAEAIINRLGEGLLGEKEKVRAGISTALALIGIRLISDQRMDEMTKLSHKLIQWIKFETIMTNAYKHICNQLKSLAQTLILNHRLSESNHILEPFSLIHSGKIKKDEGFQALSKNVLNGVASDDVLAILMHELQTDEKKLREHAINTLVILGSNASGPLLDLLDNLSKSTFPGTLKEKVRLQKSTCIALGRIGSEDAVPALKAILEQRDPLSKEAYDDEVQAAAGSALEMISKKHTGEDHTEPSEKEETKPTADKEKIKSVKTEPAEDAFSQQLKLVDQHVEKKDVGSAVKLLFDMIVKYAKQKDFEKAESLKERLLEIDPMALNEIIKSNEIIEEEKSASIDQDYLNIWPELYKTLTREETNTLFYAMKSATYDANKSIFLQGESTSKLYFIYKGRLKMVFNQKDEEILIKELNPGDILGDDTFFYLTVCTTSVITLSRVEVHFLEKGILTKWENEFPHIKARLRDHCLGFEKISDLLKKRGLDRRSQKRVKISSMVLCQSIDASGSPIGQSIRGTLSDMSTGGLSFDLNIPKEKAAKMFLEPKLNVKFTFNEGESKKSIDQKGVVVAVLSHLYDYSIHFEFDKMLDEKMIERIKASENSENGELELFTSS